MIPQGAKRIELRPLAFGEVTGHNHRLVSDGSVAVEDACELYEHSGSVFDPEGLVGGLRHFLRVKAEGISLIHAGNQSDTTADHQPHQILPGEYEVVIQEETTDWGTRPVFD